MKITYSQLRRLGACAKQLDTFKERFGKKVDVTEELCTSVASVFNWDWAARYFLPTIALAEYERTLAVTWAEYDRALAAAWAEYDRAKAGLAEYDCATDAAWAEYERARTAAWDKYERTLAGAFGRLLNKGVQP